MSKRKGRKRKGRAGWRVNGKRIYYVKGKTASTRKTFKSKASARAHARRRR